MTPAFFLHDNRIKTFRNFTRFPVNGYKESLYLDSPAVIRDQRLTFDLRGDSDRTYRLESSQDLRQWKPLEPDRVFGPDEKIELPIGLPDGPAFFRAVPVEE